MTTKLFLIISISKYQLIYNKYSIFLVYIINVIILNFILMRKTFIFHSNGIIITFKLALTRQDLGFGKTMKNKTKLINCNNCSTSSKLYLSKYKWYTQSIFCWIYRNSYNLHLSLWIFFLFHSVSHFHMWSNIYSFRIYSNWFWYFQVTRLWKACTLFM